MKKTYRLTIDYMIEINEKVKADGEYSRELLEKTQHIMNAFFLAQGVLLEFNKDSFYEGFLDVDPWGNDMGELLGIKDQYEYMKTLNMHLPSNARTSRSCLHADRPTLQALLLPSFRHSSHCHTPGYNPRAGRNSIAPHPHRFP